MKLHRWLDFKVTARCNNAGAQCAYCDVPVVGPEEDDVLSIEAIHETLADARALGFDTFCFLGGEVTLRPDAHRLFEPIADEREISLTVATNGKAPNWPLVEALYGAEAARATVQFSLDSMLPSNAKRADPNAVLDLVERTNGVARRWSRPGRARGVEVHTVISRENLATFDAFALALAARRIPVSLAMVCPWELVEEPRTLRQFTRAEIEGVSERIHRLRTGLATDAFNRLVAEFATRHLHGAYLARTCGAGLTQLVVNPDGDVHACMARSFRPDEAVGNIRRERLHSILARIPEPSHCPERTDCFDGFAWDELAVGLEARPA